MIALSNRTLLKALSVIALPLAFIALSPSYAQAADAEHGEQLSQTCLGCHGAPGLRNPGPVYSIPMIGGQHAAYIVSALQAYRAKQRGHKTMQAQAASLSDDDIADIAEFFSAMAGNSRPSHVNSDSAKMGQKKSALCASCHGAEGDAPTDAYPKLAGQYESYVEQALKDYRSGERQNPIMAGFAANLTIEEIRALSAWFASQQGGLSAPESVILKW